jgi:hypothetical protein
MKKLIYSVTTALLITSTVYAFDFKIQWDANPKSDNVTNYKVYRCMSSAKGICQPRPKKDPTYPTTGLVYTNITTVSTTITGASAGIHNVYVTAASDESGASNRVMVYSISPTGVIKLVP